MSDTPRTDYELSQENIEGQFINVAFARQLERDLAVARDLLAAKDAEIERLRSDSEFRLMRDQLASACAEITRLRGTDRCKECPARDDAIREKVEEERGRIATVEANRELQSERDALRAEVELLRGDRLFVEQVRRAERAEDERDGLRAALLAAESLRIDHHDAGKMAGLVAGRFCPSCVHDGAEDHRLAVIAKALARKHGEVAG